VSLAGKFNSDDLFTVVTFNNFICIWAPLPIPFWCDPSFTTTFKGPFNAFFHHQWGTLLRDGALLPLRPRSVGLWWFAPVLYFVLDTVRKLFTYLLTLPVCSPRLIVASKCRAVPDIRFRFRLSNSGSGWKDIRPFLTIQFQFRFRPNMPADIRPRPVSAGFLKIEFDIPLPRCPPLSSSSNATASTCSTLGQRGVSPIAIFTSDVLVFEAFFEWLQHVARVARVLGQIAVLMAVEPHFTVVDGLWHADARSCRHTN